MTLIFFVLKINILHLSLNSNPQFANFQQVNNLRWKYTFYNIIEKQLFQSKRTIHLIPKITRLPSYKIRRPNSIIKMALMLHCPPYLRFYQRHKGFNIFYFPLFLILSSIFRRLIWNSSKGTKLTQSRTFYIVFVAKMLSTLWLVKTVSKKSCFLYRNRNVPKILIYLFAFGSFYPLIFIFFLAWNMSLLEFASLHCFRFQK